jgi:hypothetical protein
LILIIHTGAATAAATRHLDGVIFAAPPNTQPISFTASESVTALTIAGPVSVDASLVACLLDWRGGSVAVAVAGGALAVTGSTVVAASGSGSGSGGVQQPHVLGAGAALTLFGSADVLSAQTIDPSLC